SRIASRTICSRSNFALVVISPPTITMLLFAYVSHATRLYLSCARQASRTASEIVSQTLSGWPSPTDSEEKINFLLIQLLPTFVCVEIKISTYQDAKIRSF